MGKNLIIKGADFSNVKVNETAKKPTQDIVLTKNVVENNKLLYTSLKIGDTLRYQPFSVTGYTVWGVPVEYANATYKLVADTTQYGSGDNIINDNYCVFAVVLNDENIILDVILAHGNASLPINNDTYEIDMSKYNTPTKLYFNNNTDVTVTVLSE